MDTIGEMVLRDAVINEKVIKLKDMEGFNHLEEPYLAYKQSEAVFYFIENRYGKEKIAKFFNLLNGESGEINAYKKVFMKSQEEFEKEFMLYIKKKYWAQTMGRDTPDKYGPRLTNATREKIIYNQSPVFSPDETKIAFISTINGERAIHVANVDGTNIKRMPFKYSDGLSADGFPISWSKDDYIYYSVVEKGKKLLMRGNVKTGSSEKINVQGVETAYGPSISPDGNYLAFIGANNGFTDVYICDASKKTFSNLTQNLFNNDFVSWSPDGTSLIFTEERDEVNKIIIYDVKNGEMKFMTQNKDFNYVYPRFLTGVEIIFVSDKNGIYNLYKMDLKDKQEMPLTNVINGIFCPSVSERYIVYSYYEDGCYNIYKYMLNKTNDVKEIPLAYLPSGHTEKNESDLKSQFPQSGTNVVNTPMKIGGDEEFRKSIEETADKIIKSDTSYITTFTPDILMGVFGFSTESGILGSGYVTLSDMLGNNTFSLLANFVPDYYTQFEFEYLYMSLPFDVGFKTFYYQNIYEIFDTNTGIIFSQLDSTEFGGKVYFKYPFNVYSSLTMEIATDHINDKYTNFETSNIYLFSGNKDNVLNSISFYFYTDNTLWRNLWPYSGRYFMAYATFADKIFNGTKAYNIYEIDYGRFFDFTSFLENTIYSLKITFAESEGEDRPYYILGGFNTIRGMNYGEYISNKILLFKNEFRYILARNMNFTFLPMNFLILKNIKATIFNDSCLLDNIGFDTAVNGDMKSTLGFGLIFDTFFFQRQFLPFKFEVAKRIDIGGDNWIFYFYLNASY